MGEMSLGNAATNYIGANEFATLQHASPDLSLLAVGQTLTAAHHR
jgi:uncharacterized protein YejL (UPF0352 family)